MWEIKEKYLVERVLPTAFKLKDIQVTRSRSMMTG